MHGTCRIMALQRRLSPLILSLLLGIAHKRVGRSFTPLISPYAYTCAMPVRPEVECASPLGAATPYSRHCASPSRCSGSMRVKKRIIALALLSPRIERLGTSWLCCDERVKGRKEGECGVYVFHALNNRCNSISRRPSARLSRRATRGT